MDFGGRSEYVFVNVRIFSAFTLSNAFSSLCACYKQYENIKKRAYKQQVQEVEHASFAAIDMSVTATHWWPGSRNTLLFINSWNLYYLVLQVGDEYLLVMDLLCCALPLVFFLLCVALYLMYTYHGAYPSIEHRVISPPPMNLVGVECN